ncbi:hypothetical protein SETIT_6G219500v2 [Setaria italica]|uniref:Uncharacterized protein n=1 Tax=Setaria italica TaxID=4555 RepID=A0A368RP81_SETIT|nr:hypothetical protein SETIT_6G219500v2 [Setaria italica]
MVCHFPWQDIWVYFRDVTTAEKFLSVLGFVKFDDKSSAWDGETRPSKDLMRLLKKFCDDKNPLFVQCADLQYVITKKLNMKYSYDPNVVDEVIHEEKDNITREYCLPMSKYCLPMSKGLQHFLQDNLINVSPTMFTADFMSEIGLAQYLNLTLKQVPKISRESFDEHVCRIGDSIENDLKYARMFSPDLLLKIQKADRVATQYREEKLTMHNRETIVGGLTHLLAVPKQRDDIMTQVKLMEAKLRKAELGMLEDTDDLCMREHTNLEPLKFRTTLLETPSGFAIFYVNEDVVNPDMLSFRICHFLVELAKVV